MPSKPPCFRPFGHSEESWQAALEEALSKRKQARQKQNDRKRLSSSQRGYNARWRKARKAYLKQNPLCVACKSIGVITEATVVDHIKPHKGDQELFWDRSNWQSLCKRCHDRKTAKYDGGFGNREGGI